MSVEKLPTREVTRESIPFAQIANEVIWQIKDNDAFRIWAFSYSKSSDWEVIKEFTEKQCGVGERKGKQVWSYLARCGLCETIVHRDEKGKIVKHELRILNGLKFDPNIPFLLEKSTGAETAPMDKLAKKSAFIHRCKNPPGGQTTRVEMSPLLNKDKKQNKDLIQNKEKSFYENSKKHDFAQSMNQMANEKKHIYEHIQRKAMELQPMPEELREKLRVLKRGCVA